MPKYREFYIFFLRFNKIIHKVPVGIPIMNVSRHAAEKNPDASFPMFFPKYSICIATHTATIVTNRRVDIAVKMISIILIGRFIIERKFLKYQQYDSILYIFILIDLH